MNKFPIQVAAFVLSTICGAVTALGVALVVQGGRLSNADMVLVGVPLLLLGGAGNWVVVSGPRLRSEGSVDPDAIRWKVKNRDRLERQ